jgi:hypothetical protein
MARPQKRLNDAKSEVIEDNFLKQDPEGLPDSSGIVIAKHIPPMRRIIFLNGRDPGQELMFHYHSSTHPLKHYTLFHGKEYDLSEEVIQHLENCAERQYGYRQGQSGHPEMYTKSLKYIFQCKSVKKVA